MLVSIQTASSRVRTSVTIAVCCTSVCLLTSDLFGRGADFANEDVDVTYYVSTTGDDANTGISPDSPLRNPGTALNKAKASLAAGKKTRVYILNGTYHWKGSRGASLDPGATFFKIEGESKGGVIIDGSGTSGRALILSRNMSGDFSRQNLIMRNLVIRNVPQTGVYIGNYNMNGGLPDNSNIWIQDCEFNKCGTSGLIVWHANKSTIEGVKCIGNGGRGMRLFMRRSIMRDCEFSNNGEDGIWWGAYDSEFSDIECEGNKWTGFRMDHVGVKCDIVRLTCRGNSRCGTMVETAQGPMTFTDCLFEGNGSGANVNITKDIAFVGCEFRANRHVALQTTNKRRTDPSRCRPPGWACLGGNFTVEVGQKWHNLIPLEWNERTTLDGCVLTATGTDTWLIAKTRGVDHARDAHQVWARSKLSARNNTYWNPDNTRVFDIGPAYRPPSGTDLEGWKAQVAADPNPDWDEDGSSWMDPALRDRGDRRHQRSPETKDERKRDD